MVTQCMYKGSIYGNIMHVQRTNPTGIDVQMYRGPIVLDSAWSYTYLRKVRALCHVRMVSYKETKYAQGEVVKK